jgi:hypothetical protein
VTDEEDARAEMQAALGPPRATARLLAILTGLRQAEQFSSRWAEPPND